MSLAILANIGILDFAPLLDASSHSSSYYRIEKETRGTF